jgi:hypothetical protein
VKTFWSGLVALVVVGSVLVAASDCQTGPYAVCAPASVVACTGGGCTAGHLVCNEDGTGYGSCTCSSESESGSGSGSSSGSSSGGGSGSGGPDGSSQDATAESGTLDASLGDASP